MEHIEKAVIPAAGMGTRMRPLSLFIPKEMLPISSNPILYYSILEAAAIGCMEIIIILSPDKGIIKQYTEWLKEQSGFSHLTFIYLHQEQPTGIADALLLAEERVGACPFAVLYPDNIFIPPHAPYPLEHLLPVFYSHGSSVIAAEEFEKPESILPYGNIKGAWLNNEKTVLHVQEIIEKPLLEQVTTLLSTTGRHIMLPDIFDYYRKIQRYENKERYATNALNIYASEKELLAVPLRNIRRCDAGNLAGYNEAFVSYVTSERAANRLFSKKQ